MNKLIYLKKKVGKSKIETWGRLPSSRGCNVPPWEILLGGGAVLLLGWLGLKKLDTVKKE